MTASTTPPFSPPFSPAFPPPSPPPSPLSDHGPQREAGATRITAPFVWLASRSPRRRELLTQLGVRHELLLAGPGEDDEALEALRQDESPNDYVARVTLAKLRVARERLQARGLTPAPILAADTTVAIGGRILGKPADADDARRILTLLSGRTHRVLTSVAIAVGATRVRQAINVSRVRFDRLDKADIDRYIATGEPFDKAGAYGIQGAAAAFVRRIEGSYSGIMGLPLYETRMLLRLDRESRIR